MLTKEQINILSVFKQDLFARFTFKDVKKLSRQKSNNVVQIALKEYQRLGIVNTVAIGDVTTYGLNLDNAVTMSYFNLINAFEVKKRKLPECLETVKNGILKHTEFFVLLVFGSYAKGKATLRSDLDLALIVESEQTKKELIPSVETVRRREIIDIDYHIFTRTEFLSMLTEDFQNLGKQILKESIVYYGYVPYWELKVKHGRPNGIVPATSRK